MLLFFDIDSRKLIDGVGIDSPISTVEARRGADEELRVGVISNGVLSELAEGATLKAVVKPKGNYDGASLTSVAPEAFVWDAETSHYVASINYVTTALDTLFAVDGNASNDVEELELGLELAHKPATATDWHRNTNNVTLTLKNNALRADDEDPIDPSERAMLEYLANHFVRHDAAQILSTTDKWRVLNNLGITYEASAGALKVTLPDGSYAWHLLTDWPS